VGGSDKSWLLCCVRSTIRQAASDELFEGGAENAGVEMRE